MKHYVTYISLYGLVFLSNILNTFDVISGIRVNKITVNFIVLKCCPQYCKTLPQTPLQCWFDIRWCPSVQVQGIINVWKHLTIVKIKLTMIKHDIFVKQSYHKYAAIGISLYINLKKFNVSLYHILIKIFRHFP